MQAIESIQLNQELLRQQLQQQQQTKQKSNSTKKSKPATERKRTKKRKDTNVKKLKLDIPNTFNPFSKVNLFRKYHLEDTFKLTATSVDWNTPDYLKASKLKTHTATTKARMRSLCSSGWNNKSNQKKQLSRTDLLYIAETIANKFPDYVFTKKEVGQLLWNDYLPKKFKEAYEKVPLKNTTSQRVSDANMHEFILNYCANGQDCIDLITSINQNWGIIKTILNTYWNEIYHQSKGRQEQYNMILAVEERKRLSNTKVTV